MKAFVVVAGAVVLAVAVVAFVVASPVGRAKTQALGDYEVDSTHLARQYQDLQDGVAVLAKQVQQLVASRGRVPSPADIPPIVSVRPDGDYRSDLAQIKNLLDSVGLNLAMLGDAAPCAEIKAYNLYAVSLYSSWRGVLTGLRAHSATPDEIEALPPEASLLPWRTFDRRHPESWDCPSGTEAERPKQEVKLTGTSPPNGAGLVGGRDVRVASRDETMAAVADHAANRPTLAELANAKDPLWLPPSAGYLIASTTPWAQISIDGRPTGKMTPVTQQGRIALSPGVHTLGFTVGERTHTFDVEVQAGQTLSFSADLTTDPPRRTSTP